MDLAGQERVARLNNSEKLYKEALFINESLECLMGNCRSASRGETPKATIHPVMHMLSDTIA